MATGADTYRSTTSIVTAKRTAFTATGLQPATAAQRTCGCLLSDPRNPVPTKGGGLCCWPAELPGGAHDQRAIEARPDVLVYTTPVLEREVEVTGPVTLTLFAATSAVDTDFTGKLVDVHPDGFARNLTDGIIRARYRESRTQGTLLKPGEVYEYTIDLWERAMSSKPGIGSAWRSPAPTSRALTGIRKQENQS